MASLEALIVLYCQGCGVGRYFRIPTPSLKLYKFKKSTATPHFLKTDSDSSNFEKTTPTPDSS